MLTRPADRLRLRASELTDLAPPRAARAQPLQLDPSLLGIQQSQYMLISCKMSSQLPVSCLSAC